VRRVQLAVQRFLLKIERRAFFPGQMVAQVGAHDFVALAACRVAEKRIRVQRLAATLEEGQPRFGVEGHVVDDGAVHVEDERALR